MRRCFPILIVACASGAAELPPPAQVKADFARDIQPLFERSCVSCHGAQRPRSGLRLDNRDAAMKGGDHGAAIIPGDSAKSPIVLVVAGLHPEIEKMPPEGKGQPFSPEEIALLRAWIDQGAEWSAQAFVGPKSTISATPVVRWIAVTGDEGKFREHVWMKEGVQAGIHNFFLQERLSADSTVTAEGHAFPADDDFAIELRYDRTGVGFAEVGFNQFRRYYDDSGGFYPFTQPLYSLDRDLELRMGRAWIDLGLTLPDAPQLAVGYEYRFRRGTKSTLQWGAVSSGSPVIPNPVRRNIYPAFKEVDEATHIVKFDAAHEIDGLYLEDNFRAEWYDLNTERQNAISVVDGQPRPAQFEILDEAHREFRAVNALRFEKEIRDWWFVSGGYLHSGLDADASFRQTTVHATGLPIAGDFWRTRSIILSQNSLLLNGNTRLGPWEHLTLSAGVQSEWMRQEGIGNVSLDTGNPATFLTIVPATLDANLHKHTLQENAALRYTGLPYTSLFAEGRLEQEWAGTFEQALGGHHPFRRDTDATSDLEDLRAGFYTSPRQNVSFGGHYRYRDKHTDYDDRFDDTAGYPAFFRERTIKTHEIEANVTWRPLSWLKTKLTYQLLDTDFDSDTDIGGWRHAGTFNANVYGVNLTLTPFSRWYLSGTLNYYDSRSASAHNDLAVAVPYRGEIYSALASLTYMVTTNTDLTLSYTFSRADYAQNNFAAALPLGIDYDWQVVQGGIVRRFKRAAVSLQYAFYQYDEPSSGGFNDYTAHAVFTTVSLNWP